MRRATGGPDGIGLSPGGGGDVKDFFAVFVYSVGTDCCA
jgi:hypothetical protein